MKKIFEDSKFDFVILTTNIVEAAQIAIEHIGKDYEIKGLYYFEEGLFSSNDEAEALNEAYRLNAEYQSDLFIVKFVIDLDYITSLD